MLPLSGLLIGLLSECIMAEKSGVTTQGLNDLIAATVKDARIDSQSRLIVEFFNGETSVAGNLRGAPGLPGDRGVTGNEGASGDKGIKGVFTFQGSAAKINAGIDDVGNISPAILADAFKMVSGSVNVTPTSANAIMKIDVKFPTGRFSDAPTVVLQNRSSQAGTAVSESTISTPTVEGFSIYAKRTNTTTFSIGWIAVGT